MKRLFVYISSLRLLLHYAYYRLAANHDVMCADVERNALQFIGINDACGFYAFCHLMTFYRMFRNVFYARVGCRHHYYAKLLSLFAPPQPLLNVSETSEIGGGLIVQHGYGTIISPAKMGRNCWVNQGVSIGHRSAKGQPVIGDDVRIAANALVLGAVRVGRGATIAPGAVVMRHVPPYAIVTGNPARVVGFNMSPDEADAYERQHYTTSELTGIERLRSNYEKYYISRRDEIAAFLK